MFGADLERAESELQRLRLRVEGRPVPYYRVVNEFFSEKLGNFVEPDHKCACNVCCLNLEALKQKAVEEALAAVEARKASADSAGVNQNSNGQQASEEQAAGGAGAASRSGPAATGNSVLVS